MSIDKTTSIILSATPYRESSYLTTLFSLEHGRISCIAKGFRKNNRQSMPLERGSLIEHTLYHRPHRDLHQITDSTLIEFFPGIRADLEKTALRDLMLDILLASLSISDCNEQLFSALHTFLVELDLSDSGSSSSLRITAQSLFAVAGSLGFSPEFSCCSSCGTIVDQHSSFYFSISDGTLRCSPCKSPSTGSYCALSHSSIAAITPAAAGTADILETISAPTALSLLRIAVDYCRYHFDIRKKLSSLVFIEQLFSLPVFDNDTSLPKQLFSTLKQTLTTKETICQILP